MVMSYPPLRTFASEADCRAHYELTYCQAPLFTFDKIAVRFRKGDFTHCFCESSKRDRNKDVPSSMRRERIDWIKTALGDSTALLKAGWDRDNKVYTFGRRVAVVQTNYVVVIQFVGNDLSRAEFKTAYVADTERTLRQILASPNWK